LSESVAFGSKSISLPVKFTAVLARSLVLRGKLCFRNFRRVKDNTSNSIRTIIFNSERREEWLRLKFEVTRYFSVPLPVLNVVRMYVKIQNTVLVLIILLGRYMSVEVTDPEM